MGIFAQWLAWRVNIPAILPLIAIGLILGPLSQLLTPDGAKLVDPQNIFEGRMMYYFVSLSVGIILFEGGMTLRLSEVKHVANTVRNLLIAGSVIMLLGGGLAAHLLVDMDWDFAMLFGSLIIVTGPTVISPILRSVHATKNVSTILKWESILIDPIGALVAVLVYKILFVGRMFSDDVSIYESFIGTLLPTIFVGSLVGAFFAWIMYILLKRDLVPHFLQNVVALALVVFAFAGADLVAHESGLLSVTVMGVVLANTNLRKLDQILEFKESLTVILVSLLFIILASNIDIEAFGFIGPGALALLLVVMLVLRPLAVFLSAWKSNLNTNEKIFVSWIGPKGIVAAAIASLFALYIMENELSPEQLHQAQMLTPLTFSMILGTVLINGLTAKPLARMLDVIKKESDGFLLVGANEIAVCIGRYIQSIGLPVVLLDNSRRNLKYAIANDLRAIEENVLDEEISELLEYEDAGRMMALTSSHDINIFAVRKFRQNFGTEKVFRLITANEMKFSKLTRPKNILFGGDADFIRLMGLVRRFKEIRELKPENQEHLNQILVNESDNLIPIFLRTPDNKLKTITGQFQVEFAEGDVLAYVGEYDPEKIAYGQAQER